MELIGKTFGFLTVLGLGEPIKNSQGKWAKRWLCECICGKLKLIRTHNLTGGNAFSCGCLTQQLKSIALTKHGQCGTRAYSCWLNMKQRCQNPRHPHFPLYGGRGIRVCSRWSESFENFLYDMGHPPEGLSIDRIDNNGDYEPENCKWSTQSEQRLNQGGY